MCFERVKGVPQDRHAHALQARGRQLLEESLPGIGQQLHDAGAPVVDFCRQARLHLPAGTPAPQESGILIQPVSRPLLETTIRTRITAATGVWIRDGCTVTGLRTDPAARQVTGVHLHHRASGSRARESSALAADLVADTSGRNSHLPRWLTDLGFPRPDESTMDPRVGYASRTYRTDQHTPTPWRALLAPPHAPGHARGCFALHIEQQHLIVTLQGADGDHPPADEHGFTAFAESLPHDLAAVISTLEPVSPIVRYARTTSQRRHYHRLPHWPDRLIALGDAACVFNPVYAQGMTVAAQETRALHTMLDHRHDLTGLARAFQHRVAAITAWPWTMTAIADHRWHTDEPGSYPTRAGQWLLDRWYDLAPRHPRMHRDLARVTNMLTGPATLTNPRHLHRLLLDHQPRVRLRLNGFSGRS